MRRPAGAEEVARALEALAGEPASEPESSWGVLRAREQRFACVLMTRTAATRTLLAQGDREETSHVEQGTRADSVAPWGSIARASGAQFEVLRTGAVVFVWSGEGTASDIARRAAGAALELAPFFGDGAKVLASRRASEQDALPVGGA
ncbi:MAG: hypothetical protein ACK5U8_22015, partial [Deltaproteobacteria bacterium]